MDCVSASMSSFFCCTILFWFSSCLFFCFKALISCSLCFLYLAKLFSNYYCFCLSKYYSYFIFSSSALSMKLLPTASLNFDTSSMLLPICSPSNSSYFSAAYIYFWVISSCCRVSSWYWLCTYFSYWFALASLSAVAICFYYTILSCCLSYVICDVSCMCYWVRCLCWLASYSYCCFFCYSWVSVFRLKSAISFMRTMFSVSNCWQLSFSWLNSCFSV